MMSNKAAREDFCIISAKAVQMVRIQESNAVVAALIRTTSTDQTNEVLCDV